MANKVQRWEARCLPGLLGYTHDQESIFAYKGDRAKAREAILIGNNTQVGEGMRAGSLVAKVYGEKAKIGLLTPQTRSWFGPIYEGTLRDSKDAGVLLQGRFRLTTIEMISCALLQFSAISWMISFLVGGGHQKVIAGLWPKIGISIFIVLGILFCPRLSWLTRRWKMEAVKDQLIRQGFSLKGSVSNGF